MWGIKEVWAASCILECQWWEATGMNFPVGFQPEEVGLSWGDSCLFAAPAVLLCYLSLKKRGVATEGINHYFGMEIEKIHSLFCLEGIPVLPWVQQSLQICAVFS